MAAVSPIRLNPDRAAALSILGGLAGLTVLAWAATVWQTSAGDRLMMVGVPMSLEMGGRLGVASAGVFLLIWIVMMAAMMFPSVWPVVLVYAAVVRTRGRGSVLLFVAGYLLVWEALGVLAYAGYVGMGAVLASTAGMGGRVAALTGALVIVAGLYQFTPLKRACLAHCWGPLQHLSLHWRDGRAGSLRMGLAHGSYCLGCCAADARAARARRDGSPLDGHGVRRDRAREARPAAPRDAGSGGRRAARPWPRRRVLAAPRHAPNVSVPPIFS